MRFQKVVDIWTLTQDQVRKLQPGQWVYAGTDTPETRGKFWGVKTSGTVVVAWQGNAKNRDWAGYQKSLRDYARN